MSERTGSLSFGGKPMGLCLYLASRPKETFTTSEVADFLGLPSKSVTATLRGAIEAGLVSREIGYGRTETVYSVGPEVLSAIGQKRKVEDGFKHVRKPAKDACPVILKAIGSRTALEQAWL